MFRSLLCFTLDSVSYARRCARGLQNFVKGLSIHRRCHQKEMPPILTCVFEQASLFFTNAIRANDYYRYGLYRKDMSPAAKREYIGSFELARWQQRFNVRSYHGITEDKLVFEQYLRDTEAPTPRTIAVLGEGPVVPGTKHLDSLEDLADWLLESSREDLFLKPINTMHGNGALSLSRRSNDSNEWERLPGKQPINVKEILEHCKPYLQKSQIIIQHRLRPHERLNRFSPDVLHTARVLTLRTLEETQILGACLKIGTGHSPVDNLLKGNIVAPINLITGTLGQGVSVVNDIGVPVENESSNATGIEGLELPAWDDAKAVVALAHRHLYFFPVLGWDLAFTSDGPVIVECNAIFDPILTQIACKQGLFATPFRQFLDERGLTKHIGFKLW